MSVYAYSQYALLNEKDATKQGTGCFSEYSTPPLPKPFAFSDTELLSLQQMAASKKNSSNGSDSGKTEILVHTFTHSEDAVIPADEEIVSVEHDRSMAVTRVVTKRAWDEKRSEEEKAEAAGPPATPTYPQTAGAVPALDTDLTAPPTSYTWGSIDTTKVQNLQDLEKLPPPIAVQEASQKPQEQKDETEVSGEVQQAANEESAEPAHTPDKPADKSSAKAAKDLSEVKGSDQR